MKKLFTLILLLAAAVSASAANFQLMFGDDPSKLTEVQNGATYNTGYEVEDLGFMKRYAQNSNLYIKAASGTKMTIEVQSTEVVQVCAFGGCENSTSVNKTGTLGIDQQPVSGDIYDLLIDKTANNTVPTKDITLTVSVYETANPASKVTVTVNMLAKPASEVGLIESAEVVGNYVKLLSGNTLKYHFDSATRLEIYNIAGRLVLSRTVNGNGALRLELSNGIYIYRAANLTGKFLLK